MKTCPYCAEEIQDQAIVCKHCGRDLAPEAVAEVSEKLAQVEDDPNGIAPAEGAEHAEPAPVRSGAITPIWVIAVRLAVVVTTLMVLFDIVQIIAGRMSWDEFIGSLGSTILTGFVATALISSVGIWLWRLFVSPAVASTSLQDDNAQVEAAEEEEEQLSDVIVPMDDDQATALPSAEAKDGAVYSLPEGLVAAPAEPQRPIWKKAAGVGGALAALQLILVISGISSVAQDPELAEVLQPGRLILTIPIAFGVGFGIAALVILGWRYARSRM